MLQKKKGILPFSPDHRIPDLQLPVVSFIVFHGSQVNDSDHGDIIRKTHSLYRDNLESTLSNKSIPDFLQERSLQISEAFFYALFG